MQVLGNHEYYGDLSAGHAMNIFGTPDADYYSVEYGNVYIAVVKLQCRPERSGRLAAGGCREDDVRMEAPDGPPAAILHKPQGFERSL